MLNNVTQKMYLVKNKRRKREREIYIYIYIWDHVILILQMKLGKLRVINQLWKWYKAITISIKEHKKLGRRTMQVAGNEFALEISSSNNICFGWREYRNYCSHQICWCHVYFTRSCFERCKVLEHLLRRASCSYAFLVLEENFSPVCIWNRIKDQ